MNRMRGWSFLRLMGTVISDPLKIATEANGGNTTIFEPGELQNGEAANNIAWLLNLGSLYKNIETQAIIITIFIVFGLLITMLFIRRSDKLAERKMDILHKLGIVLLIMSLLGILEIYIAIVDYIF